MNWSNGIIWAGAFFALASAISYLMNRRAVGRLAYGLAFLVAVGVQAALTTLLIAERFDIHYVLKVADADTSLLFKIAASWGAQEGSFTLWVFLTALFGFIVSRKVRELERSFMIIYALLTAALTANLALHNPFLTTKQAEIAEYAKAGMPFPDNWQVPSDGFGLNPLLENIWMSIHPPIIFIGFALLGVIFSLSLAGAVDKKINWTAIARPWAVLGSTILGFGIILGGFWAYETLGWGGFWAWDPVENVSLLPWLALTAFVHLLFNRGGASEWWKIVLGGLPFILFIYGTFTTRSGALANMSVHAFAGGDGAHIAALLWISRLALAAWILVPLSRYKTWASTDDNGANEDVSAKNIAMAWGVVTLVVAVAAIAWATFFPVVASSWFNAEPRRVEPSYFLSVSGALIVPIFLLMAVTPWLHKKMTADSALSKCFVPWIASMLLATAAFLLWFPSSESSGAVERIFYAVVPTLLSALGCFAVITSIQRMFAKERKQRLAGAMLSHIGFAMLVLGLIISSAGETKSAVTLIGDKPVALNGYQYKFLGMTKDVADKTNQVVVEITSPNKKISKAYLAFYQKMRPNGQTEMVRWPFIQVGPFKDRYISFTDNPTEMENPDIEPLLITLKKQKQAKIGPYTLIFSGFALEGQMGKGAFRVSCKLSVSRNDKQENIAPGIAIDEQRMSRPLPARISDGALVFAEPNPSDESATFYFFKVPGYPNTQPRPTDWIIPLDISEKPMTSLVWAGSAFMLIGGLFASINRFSLQKSN